MAKMSRKAAAAKKAAVQSKEAVKETVKVEETVAAKADETVVKAEETVAKTAEPVKEETVETVEAVKEEAAKTETVKKAPAKKTAIKEELILQFGGNEISQADIIKKVKENWTKVQKNKIKDIKTISVYLQPENGCAYYVINGEGADDYKVEL